MTARARGAVGAAARPGAPALGTDASNSSPAAREDTDPDVGTAETLAAQTRRAERWWLLGKVRQVTGLSRLRQCRRTTLTGTGGPTLRVSPGRGAGYAGLSTCGSVWSCPCCAPKIAAERASDLADVIAAVHRAGGSAYLVTLTMRHHRGQRLADLWDASAAGWAAVTSGKAWVADQQGMRGWARVVEATHTPRAGWHVHIHVLMCWDHDVDDLAAQRMALRAWRRWDAALRRRGLDSTPVHGVDARRVRVGSEGLGEYFTKAAREVTGGHAKDSRSGRSPLAILRDAVETYAADDLALLWEWEAASHGRQQLTWSTSPRMDLRRFAGLGRERSDDEVAADDQGGEDLVALSEDAWRFLTRTGTVTFVLDLAERGGAAAVTAWLDDFDLPWAWATPIARRDRRTTITPDQRRQARAVLPPERPAGTESPR